MFDYFKNRRRRRLLAEPPPGSWSGWLEANLWHFRHMDQPKRHRLLQVAQVLLHEKAWSGCGGLELSEEMRVTIAAAAGLMVLGPAEPYYFDRLKSILVYQDSYRPRSDSASTLLESDPFEPIDPSEAREGEAWRGGPVIVSWRNALRDGRSPHRGRHLVLHELAHHLDGLDGGMEGTPPMFGQQKLRRWRQVVEREHQRLVEAAERGRPTLLDDYGAQDAAEFFAVATECFFQQPHPLRRRHSELYAVLCDFYQQSPTDWLPEA